MITKADVTCWDRDAKNTAACGSEVKGIFLVELPNRASCPTCRMLAGLPSEDLRNPEKVALDGGGMMRRHGPCVCVRCKPFVMSDLKKVLRLTPPHERHAIAVEAINAIAQEEAAK